MKPVADPEFSCAQGTANLAFHRSRFKRGALFVMCTTTQHSTLPFRRVRFATFSASEIQHLSEYHL